MSKKVYQVRKGQWMEGEEYLKQLIPALEKAIDGDGILPLSSTIYHEALAEIATVIKDLQDER